MQIEWDEAKNELNVRKHGLDFEDASLVFESPCITKIDDRQDYGEERFITYGLLVDRLVVIAHTRRDDKQRIISMRKANEREKKSYQERFESTRSNDG